MNLFKYFAEAFAPDIKTILCDGDCGRVYHEEDLNRTACGQDLCNDCMFTFLAEQECDQ